MRTIRRSKLAASKAEYLILVTLLAIALLAGALGFASRVQDRYTDSTVEVLLAK